MKWATRTKLKGGYGKKIATKAKPHAKSVGGKLLSATKKTYEWGKIQKTKSETRRIERRKKLGLDKWDNWDR